MEYKFKVPQTLPAKITGKVLGAPIRAASTVGGMPKGLLEGVNWLNRLGAATSPENVGMNLARRFKGIPTVDYSQQAPQIPQNLIDLLPGTQSLSKLIKEKTPLGEYGPSNMFESEPWIDNPLLAVASAPLLGASTLGSIIPAVGGEAGRRLLEEMKFGPGIQALGDIAGMFLGQKGQQLGGYLGGKAVPVVKSMFSGAAEEAIPGLKQVNKLYTAEEKAALKAARAKEKLSTQNQKLIERFGSAPIEEVQEDINILKNQEQRLKAELDQKKALDKSFEDYNESLNKTDAQRLKAKEKLENELDKFSAQNEDIMSKQDVASYREKMARGERVPIHEKLEAQASEMRGKYADITRDIEDKLTHEKLITEFEGATPKQLKQTATNLYDEFQASIPEGAEVSAKELELTNKILEKQMGNPNLTSESKDFIKGLISDTEGVIKNGKIKVDDLRELYRNTNSKIRNLRRAKGDLVDWENSYTKFQEATTKTMKDVTKVHPGIKTDKWFEANRIIKDIAQNANASKWMNQEFQHFGLKSLSRVLKQPRNFFMSPEVRRYVQRAVTRYTEGNLGQASKNLIAADKVAERELAKEDKYAKINSAKYNKLPKIPASGDMELTFKVKSS